jgi:hypothetical protein
MRADRSREIADFKRVIVEPTDLEVATPILAKDPVFKLREATLANYVNVFR